MMTGFSKRLAPAVMLLGLLVSPAVRAGDLASAPQGFVDIETLYQTENAPSVRSAHKKTELRGHLEVRYGTDTFHVYLAPDLYLSSGLFARNHRDDHAYREKTDVSRNLTVTGDAAELSINEGYVHYENTAFRLRVGNQIYGWGTADVLNPTACFNPHDMREFFFRDEDEIREGVFSLSGMVFFERSTLEMVMAPVHTPGILPVRDRYWAIDLDNYSLPILFDDPQKLAARFSNIGWGARLTTTIYGADTSASVYHGPDPDLQFVPMRTVIGEDGRVCVLVEPRSGVISRLGADVSRAIGDLVIQAEAAFTADKPAVLDQSTQGSASVTLPYTMDTSPFIAVSLGFNYFIPLYKLLDGHDGDTVLTVEWYRGRYLENGFVPPILSNLLSVRLQDSYLDGRVSLSLSGLWDVRKSGGTLWPKVTYDFQNGLSTSLGWIRIDGASRARNDTASVFYYYRTNDSVVWSLRYLF
ncbi:hypothetical protein JCM14469_33640 [Desulfatiferula olefinivorans]